MQIKGVTEVAAPFSSAVAPFRCAASSTLELTCELTMSVRFDRSWQRLLLTVLASIAAISCGGAKTGSPFTDNASLTLDSSSLDFGNVLVGSSKSLTGSLTASPASITLASAKLSGQGFSLRGITFPITVRAGQRVSFTAVFTPQMTGSYSGSLSFVSNASNSPATGAVTGIGIQPMQHSVDLFWSASPSEVVGYNIYRRSQSGGYSKLNASPQSGTSYTDDTVQSGATYFYAATSLDSNSVESYRSNETQVDVP